MVTTVQKAIDHEVKSWKARLCGDASVDKAMRDLADAEERLAERRRREYQEIVQQTAAKKRVEAELKEAKTRLAKVQKVSRAADGALEAKTAIKAYTAEMFGRGQRNGGGAQYRKARQEALTRLHNYGRLSMEQENDWPLFAKEWDAKMAEAHGEQWGGYFAEIVASIIEELDAGKTNALSTFMRNESTRVLGSVKTVRIPGAGR